MLKNTVDKRIKEKGYSYTDIYFEDEEFSGVRELEKEYKTIFDNLYSELESKLLAILPIKLNTKKNLLGISLNKLIKVKKDDNKLDYRHKLIIETRKLRTA